MNQLALQEWFGIPSTETLKRLKAHQRNVGLEGSAAHCTNDELHGSSAHCNKDELHGSGAACNDDFAYVSGLPVILALLWIVSLILTAVSATKMNSMIANGTFVLGEKITKDDLDFIPKIGSAASFLFWMPIVNIITSSVFTHKVRMLQ